MTFSLYFFCNFVLCSLACIQICLEIDVSRICPYVSFILRGRAVISSSWRYIFDICYIRIGTFVFTSILGNHSFTMNQNYLWTFHLPLAMNSMLSRSCAITNWSSLKCNASFIGIPRSLYVSLCQNKILIVLRLHLSWFLKVLITDCIQVLNLCLTYDPKTFC